jgi:hypothetical protein
MNFEIVKSGMVVLTERERSLTWLMLMWLWAGCYWLLLERWWSRGGWGRPRCKDDGAQKLEHFWFLSLERPIVNMQVYCVQPRV